VRWRMRREVGWEEHCFVTWAAMEFAGSPGWCYILSSASRGRMLSSVSPQHELTCLFSNPSSPATHHPPSQHPRGRDLADAQGQTRLEGEKEKGVYTHAGAAGKEGKREPLMGVGSRRIRLQASRHFLCERRL